MLEEAYKGWIDLLRRESAARANAHPLWAHVHQGFATGLGDQARERFEQGLRGFQMGMADEIEKALSEIVDRRIDSKMREVIIELLQRGIIEEEIQAFLARRRKTGPA